MRIILNKLFSIILKYPYISMTWRGRKCL